MMAGKATPDATLLEAGQGAWGAIKETMPNGRPHPTHSPYIRPRPGAGGNETTDAKGVHVVRALIAYAA